MSWVSSRLRRLQNTVKYQLQRRPATLSIALISHGKCVYYGTVQPDGLERELPSLDVDLAEMLLYDWCYKKQNGSLKKSALYSMNDIIGIE